MVKEKNTRREKKKLPAMSKKDRQAVKTAKRAGNR